MPSPATGPSAPSPPPHPPPRWNTNVQLAGDSVVVAQGANTVVSYFAQDDALMIGGFDLTDGTQRWSYPANTGSQSTSAAVSPRAFVDGDRTFVVNVLDPVDGPADEQGNFARSHPLQIIDVASGEVNATTAPEYWVGPAAGGCTDTTKACLLTRINGAVHTLSVSATGEMRVNDAPNAIPGLASLSRLDPDGTVLGETDEGTPTIGRFRNEILEWTRPLAELGVTGLERARNNVGYEHLWLATEFFAEDGSGVSDLGDADILTVSTRMIDTAEFKDSTGVYATSVLDARTGKTLWDTEGRPCFNAAFVMCSGESTARDSGGTTELLPSTQNVWKFSPRSGDKLWETSLKDMTVAPKTGWLVPKGGTLQPVQLGSNHELLNLEDGTVTQPTAEQIFGCSAEGKPFTAPEKSFTASRSTSWTGNRVTAGCSIDSDDIGASGFSEAVILSATTRPIDAAPGWNSRDKQLRVLATAEGLVAYEL